MTTPKSNYWQLLKDPRWQKKRLEIMEAAGFTCEYCGDETRTLHVHHRRYIYGRLPWEYSKEELACYCDRCHSRETTLDRQLKAAFSDCMLLDGAKELLLGYMNGLLFTDCDFKQPLPLNGIEEASGVVSALLDTASSSAQAEKRKLEYILIAEADIDVDSKLPGNYVKMTPELALALGIRLP